jgi:Trk K+ transport system NAD-binding subunit
MSQGHVLLCGNDRLSTAIEQRLARDGRAVTRLRPEPNHGVHLAESSLKDASVLVIAADDDPGNVDLALTARRLKADLPVVVRLFDEALATHVRQSLKGVTILSMSALAAPAFVEATIRAMKQRPAVRADAAPALPQPASRDRRRPDRILIAAIGGFLAVLLIFTAFFARTLRLPYVDAMYFVWTTVTTVGYGDIALKDAPGAVKIVGMVLMLTGAASLAVLFGLFTDWAVGRRLDLLRGRLPVRGGGHIVIAGGGNVGYRVASALREKGHRVVVIERHSETENLEALRSAGIHVIVADAARADTLQLAKVETASAVVSVTDSDAVNFQIALLVSARSRDVPVILRVVSPELSAHVSEHGDAIAISPIAIATERFAAAVASLTGPVV